MSDLNKRRAVFVYEAARLAAMAARAPIIPAPWEDRDDAFVTQFLKIIKKQCDPVYRFILPGDLHESWMQAYVAMGWTHGEVYDPKRKTHPDLVPYVFLAQREKDKDTVFMLLCEIARQFIYDEE